MSSISPECLESNSGPHVCRANTFQTEPFPQSLGTIFKKTKLKMVETELVGPGEDTVSNLSRSPGSHASRTLYILCAQPSASLLSRY